jgi:prepilin peptidase CpaA
MGAGDVKLLAGLGALLGAKAVLSVFLLTSLFGGLMAVCKIVSFLGKNSFTHTDGCSRSLQQAALCNPLKETMPFGIAIGFGAIGTVVITILV